MKIKIEKKEMAKTLKQVAPFFVKNSVVTNGILIKADEDITIYSLGDFSISAKIQTTENVIEEKGAVVVDGGSLLKMISSLPEGKVSLYTTPKFSLKIKTESSKKINFTLKGLSEKEYSTPPKFENENSFLMKKDILRKSIMKTVPFCGDGNNSFVTSGVLFEISKKELLMVATDYKQLSIVKNKIDFNKEKTNLVVPSILLNKIKGIMNEEGDVVISFSSNFVFFKFDNVEIISKLIEGDFVDWRQIEKVEFKDKIEINTKEFVESIKRVSILNDENVRGIKLDFAENILHLSFVDEEKGDAEEEISVNGKSKTSILLNNIYLLNALETFGLKTNLNVNSADMIQLNEDENSKIIIVGMRQNR